MFARTLAANMWQTQSKPQTLAASLSWEWIGSTAIMTMHSQTTPFKTPSISYPSISEPNNAHIFGWMHYLPHQAESGMTGTALLVKYVTSLGDLVTRWFDQTYVWGKELIFYLKLLFNCSSHV